LHSHNIVHRDMKLENLLLTASKSRILIADLGLSGLVSQKNNGYLSTCCGSPHYAAPEILANKPYKGYPIDIWSLGVILYCLICGRLPFRDEAIKERFAKIKRGKFELLRWLTMEEKNLITGMLLVNVERRFPLKKVMKHPYWLKEEELKTEGAVSANSIARSCCDSNGSDSNNAAANDSSSSANTTTEKKDPSDAQFENVFNYINDDEWQDDIITQVVSLYQHSQVEISPHALKDNKDEEMTTTTTKSAVTREAVKYAISAAQKFNNKCILNEMQGKEEEDILTILNDHHENEVMNSSSSTKEQRTSSSFNISSLVTLQDLYCTYQILLDEKREKWMQHMQQQQQQAMEKLEQQQQQMREHHENGVASSVRKMTHGLLSQFRSCN